MLETVREYAIEALDASRDAGGVRRAHATYYLRIAQTGDRSPMPAEHDNFRSALRFLLDAGDAATALELCARLWRFWFERGYMTEGRLWLDEALAAPVEASLARARALSGNGVLAHYQGDYDRAEQLCREALELSRSLDDATGVAEAYTGIALVRRTRGDTAEAETLFRKALAVYEDLGEGQGIARTLDRLGMNLVVAGDLDRARPLFERSLGLQRQLGDSHGIALGLYGLAITRPAGAHVAAQAQAAESLDILRASGDRRTFGKVLWIVAEINADSGDVETAAAQFEESLTLFVEFGDRWFCGIVLESAASLAARVGDAERAARLLGAAHAAWAAIDAPVPGSFRERRDYLLADLRSRLEDDRFEALRDEGRSLPIGATIELVQPAPSRAGVDAPEGLTVREAEVLALVAEGLTDAQVAERLVVSIRTVHAHLRSIYRKLDVRTRSGATRYALEHDLVA